MLSRDMRQCSDSAAMGAFQSIGKAFTDAGRHRTPTLREHLLRTMIVSTLGLSPHSTLYSLSMQLGTIKIKLIPIAGLYYFKFFIVVLYNIMILINCISFINNVSPKVFYVLYAKECPQIQERRPRTLW